MTKQDPYEGYTDAELADLVHARGKGRHDEAEKITERAAARAAQARASTAALLGEPTDDTDDEES